MYTLIIGILLLFPGVARFSGLEIPETFLLFWIFWGVSVGLAAWRMCSKRGPYNLSRLNWKISLTTWPFQCALGISAFLSMFQGFFLDGILFKVGFGGAFALMITLGIIHYKWNKHFVEWRGGFDTGTVKNAQNERAVAGGWNSSAHKFR